MLLDKAEAIKVKVDSPEYIAPDSKGWSPSPISALFRQVRAAVTDPQNTPADLEESRKRREEEVRRARARRRILDQVRGSPEAKEGGLIFIDPPTLGSRSRAVSEEWVCIFKLCKLYPGRDCDVNWPRRVVALRKGGNEEGERG